MDRAKENASNVASIFCAVHNVFAALPSAIASVWLGLAWLDFARLLQNSSAFRDANQLLVRDHLNVGGLSWNGQGRDVDCHWWRRMLTSKHAWRQFLVLRQISSVGSGG